MVFDVCRIPLFCAVYMPASARYCIRILHSLAVCCLLCCLAPAPASTMRPATILLSCVGLHHASSFVVGPSSMVRARDGWFAGGTARATTACLSMKVAQVPFRKYQGLGNDFILVDNREAEEPVLTAGQSADLCDRWGRTFLFRVLLENG